MINLKLLKSKKGMTLVEVISSIAIFSLVMLFVVSIFMTATNIIHINAEQKRNNTNAAAGIENKMAGLPADSNISIRDETEANFIIDFNGTIITSSGKMVEGSDTQNKANYYYFVPN